MTESRIDRLFPKEPKAISPLKKGMVLKKLPEKTIEDMFKLFETCSHTEVCRKMNIPKSTVSKYKKIWENEKRGRDKG